MERATAVSAVRLALDKFVERATAVSAVRLALDKFVERATAVSAVRLAVNLRQALRTAHRAVAHMVPRNADPGFPRRSFVVYDELCVSGREAAIVRRPAALAP